jgi:integrase
MVDNNVRLKSHSWKSKSAQSILLLLNFTEAKEGHFKNPPKMFQAFSDALYEGTLDENGDDPSELRWKSHSTKTANILIWHVEQYSDWLYRVTDEKSTLLNPYRTATKQERISNMAAWHHKESRSFLRHTADHEGAKEHSKKAREMARRKGHHHSAEPISVFDNNIAQELILKGFWRNSPKPEALNQLNLRNVLITMLLHYTGVRVSEPFHIFIDDIYEDPLLPNSAFIMVNHPIHGAAPEHWCKSDKSRKDDNRQDYLMQKFGMEDRKTSTDKNYHSGWKSGMFSSFPLYFFPSEAGVLWWRLWKLYLNTGQRVSNENNRHPFAFTNQYGAPASLEGFKKAHRNALNKLGYESSKAYGTNPHAHRHWIGTLLHKLGVDPKIVQKVLHHSSLESQESYIALAREETVAVTLKNAWSRDTEVKTTQPNPMQHGFEDVDPRGLFSGKNPLFLSKE